MQDILEITNNDTIPFTDRFNYVVREVGLMEFQQVLMQIDELEDRENTTAFLLSKLGCFH